MGVGSCAKILGQPQSECANGCLDNVCCEVSKRASSQHHCLSQLDKRLNRETSEGDICGKCKRVVRSVSE